MKQVHQIWIGSDLPAREAVWVEGVRAAAEAAGWEHRLWGWNDLREVFAGEEIVEWFERAFAACPGARVSTLASDYFRLRVLAEYGGLYLDTDFECRGAFPARLLELEAGKCIYGMTEAYGFAKVGGGLFFVPEESGKRAFAAAWELACKRLFRVLPPGCKDFAGRLQQLCRVAFPLLLLGPPWREKDMLPLWRMMGYALRVLPRTIVSHAHWGGSGASLVHQGTAHWLRG